MPTIEFPPPNTSDAADALRQEVRDFLRQALADRTPVERAHSWTGYDPDFSRALGDRGWLGMTWPQKYGGQDRSALERYVVLEELLAAGAPVSAHWIAERQSGPLLLRYGSEAQCREILPRIAAGECVFCIGMSEPDSGSDLASSRTRATSVPGGFRINGTKLWTTNAHRADYMILFCRTGEEDGRRQAGTSQLLVDLSTPGITIRPIRDMSGLSDFNEVVFEDAFIPDDALIGERGRGWEQVMSELAYERSGPDRWLSSFTLLVELVRYLEPLSGERSTELLGRIISHLIVLRRLSLSVASMLERGEEPALQAAMVKDLGTQLEQEIPEMVRQVVALEPSPDGAHPLASVLAHTLTSAPAFSLRGGTREILRGIIARGLGLR
ncbi:acyl-CoA dehydrogenase family protein [Halomonas mongoliensis]|uniref:acyl-CoA dehydrogenase family protein n=1 Tax=Halomonas mongoliensis TaxID=321265 RepID=UPI00403B0F4E